MRVLWDGPPLPATPSLQLLGCCPRATAMLGVQLSSYTPRQLFDIYCEYRLLVDVDPGCDEAGGCVVSDGAALLRGGDGFYAGALGAQVAHHSHCTSGTRIGSPPALSTSSTTAMQCRRWNGSLDEPGTEGAGEWAAAWLSRGFHLNRRSLSDRLTRVPERRTPRCGPPLTPCPRNTFRAGMRRPAPFGDPQPEAWSKPWRRCRASSAPGASTPCSPVRGMLTKTMAPSAKPVGAPGGWSGRPHAYSGLEEVAPSWLTGSQVSGVRTRPRHPPA